MIEKIEQHTKSHTTVGEIQLRYQDCRCDCWDDGDVESFRQYTKLYEQLALAIRDACHGNRNRRRAIVRWQEVLLVVKPQAFGDVAYRKHQQGTIEHEASAPIALGRSKCLENSRGSWLKNAASIGMERSPDAALISPFSSRAVKMVIAVGPLLPIMHTQRVFESERAYCDFLYTASEMQRATLLRTRYPSDSVPCIYATTA